ncbi:hypothetical protein M2146_001030 [Lachnospiraceae bacterium PF1-22]
MAYQEKSICELSEVRAATRYLRERGFQVKREKVLKPFISKKNQSYREGKKITVKELEEQGISSFDHVLIVSHDKSKILDNGIYIVVYDKTDKYADFFAGLHVNLEKESFFLRKMFPEDFKKKEEEKKKYIVVERNMSVPPFNLVVWSAVYDSQREAAIAVLNFVSWTDPEFTDKSKLIDQLTKTGDFYYKGKFKSFFQIDPYQGPQLDNQKEIKK